MNGQTVGSRQLGSTEVAVGQVLETQDGKAEMLLTPGVFLRLSDHSAVRMISPSLTDTRVELLRGSAMVEAAEVKKENRLDVIDHGANTVIEKHGIYAFKANQPTVAVFEGEAQVQQDDRTLKVKKGKESDLAQMSVEKFDVKSAEANDPLYSWSKLRSEYVAEANMSLAQTVVVGNPGWWYGTGWYWNPYFSSFAFMPGSGYLDSPFGFGFYSPAFWGSYYAPYYGFGRRPILPGHLGAFRGTTVPAFRGTTAPAFRSAPAARSFGGGMRMGGGGHIGGRR
ncbi:MAG TPA: FecR domain-containing protein [Candidatus Sulfopaludibacter sp.]|nr:FecR domain-containing protein [Candidatus Sulfopaludibacter sp.]